MRIYTQDRTAIIEMQKEVYITEISGSGCIMCTSVIRKELGTYESKKRAAEVLNEIFEYYRSGKSSYVMPEK